MDKPSYMEFAVLEISRLLWYETYYEKLQPYLGLENLQLHYMDCDSFVSSIRILNIINELKNLDYLFDFSNLDKNKDIFRDKNKKN